MNTTDKTEMRQHLICARATLYPGKSLEEVIGIVDKFIEQYEKI